MTVLGTLKSPLAAFDAVKLFLIEPNLREAARHYIGGLPFSKETSRCLVSLLRRVTRYDDMARLDVVKAIVAHGVPTSINGRRFVQRIETELAKPASGFDWYGKLLFLAKYGKPHDVLTAAEEARKIARGDLFLARQTMAVLARAVGINFARVKRIWNQEVSRGAADSASIAISLLGFVDSGFPAKSAAAYYYLFPKNPTRAYPISKFLILCAIAAGEERKGKGIPRPEVAKFVGDQWMRLALHRMHPAWFK